MALINCPECGKEISDKAESCPSCGFVLQATKENAKQQKKFSKGKTIISIITTMIILLVVFVIVLFFNKNTKETNFLSNEKIDDPIVGTWKVTSSIIQSDGESQFISEDDYREHEGEIECSLYVDDQQANFKLMGNEIICEWDSKVEKDGEYFYTCTSEGMSIYTIIMSPNDNDTCVLLLPTDDDNSTLFMFERDEDN